MMNRTATTILLFTLTSLSTACVGGAPGRSAGALLDECTGEFACTLGDDAYALDLDEVDGTCVVGGLLTLLPDGSIGDPEDRAFVSDVGSWTGGRDAFNVCGEDDCLRCARIGSTDDTSSDSSSSSSSSSSGGHCGGSSPSCYSQSPGYCSLVDGCYMQSHVRWNGDLEYECAGSSRSCSSYSSQGSCSGQDGCHWVD